MVLKPFFSFYGSKWRAVPHYPAPTYGHIIEPFAGSASYAVRHHERNVTLYEADPKIAGIWSYLTRASSHEIESLPLVFDHVDEIPGPPEAKWLVGFWLNKATAQPGYVFSAWARSGQGRHSWDETIRARIASQLPYIRHWTIRHQSYQRAANEPATWFIDPPYQDQGRHYRHHEIDYQHLGNWCQDRIGQAIVCEQQGATWLPFKPFRTMTGTNKRKSEEVVYIKA